MPEATLKNPLTGSLLLFTMSIFLSQRKEDETASLTSLLSDDGEVNLSTALDTLWESGLQQNDPRLKTFVDKLCSLQDKTHSVGKHVFMKSEDFTESIKENFPLIKKGFTGDLVIPEFPVFCKRITEIYDSCKTLNDGKVADYIPQLSRYSPQLFGVSVCTVDGQRFNLGDTNIKFPIESCCKPLNYSLALTDMSADEVHKFIGQEPSGESFNQIKLDQNHRPHNPMINTGAIVCASLLKNTLSLADRFDYVKKMYKRLAGGDYIGFNNSVFLSERATADRNFALGHYLKENKCFPENNNLQETMDFYFQLCSMEPTAESGSVIAGTLANGGVCPTTADHVIDANAVRSTLSLMHSCGMYDYSGNFAFKVGLPGKSGVSGIILLVVPNVCGICIWSPPLDVFGNSVRGINFCEELVERFNFHEYDNLKKAVKKYDPLRTTISEISSVVVNLHFGASNGDLTALRRMHMVGRNMSLSDYDGRTALHLAAAEGHLHIVKFLVETVKVDPNPRDRWGQTPLTDAKQFYRNHVVRYLERHNAE